MKDVVDYIKDIVDCATDVVDCAKEVVDCAEKIGGFESNSTTLRKLVTLAWILLYCPPDFGQSLKGLA